MRGREIICGVASLALVAFAGFIHMPSHRRADSEPAVQIPQIKASALHRMSRRARRVEKRQRANEITFWHVTDWHLNLLHDAHGDVRDLCRSPSADPQHWPAPLGHFNCDPSGMVAELAVNRMAAAMPDPTFILLGGDSHGHVPPAKDGRKATLASHRIMATMLKKAFPSTSTRP